MTRTIKAKGLVLAVFLIGLASGFVLSNVYDDRVQGGRKPNAVREHGAPDRDRNRDNVFTYLNLTDDQKTRFHAILEETRSEYMELRKQTQPEYEAIRERSFSRIREILSEEQRKKHDEILKNARDRRHRRGDGSRGSKGLGPK